jgi:hypothetical protein
LIVCCYSQHFLWKNFWLKSALRSLCTWCRLFFGYTFFPIDNCFQRINMGQKVKSKKTIHTICIRTLGNYWAKLFINIAVNSSNKQYNLKTLGHSCEGRRCLNSISIISLEKEKLTSLIKKECKWGCIITQKITQTQREDECMALESDQHQDWTFCNKIFERSLLARHVCMLILRQQVLPCI